MDDLADGWRVEFLQTVQQHEYASTLRESAIQGRLGEWTKALTSVVVTTCRQMGWQASAKGHLLRLLPVSGFEYLGMDVMAFESTAGGWHFPVAVFELENSGSDDRVAYSLWKVLCIRAELRVVFCYRRHVAQGSALVGNLSGELVRAQRIPWRMNLDGETMIIVGSRNDAATFPYGFFNCWRLNKNTGTFSLM